MVIFQRYGEAPKNTMFVLNENQIEFEDKKDRWDSGKPRHQQIVFCYI